MGAKARRTKTARRGKTQGKKAKSTDGYRFPHDMYVRGIEERWSLERFEREKAKHFPQAMVPVRVAVAGVAKKIGKPNPLAKAKRGQRRKTKRSNKGGK